MAIDALLNEARDSNISNERSYAGRAVAAGVAAFLLTASAIASAVQPYPARPVRVIVPVSAGGGVDSLARLIGQHFNAVWGQPFIVDNRPGAGGSLGAELLCALTGTQMTHVPYKGVADGYPAVISGQVNWILGSPISALPLMKAGRLKGIAVTSAARSSALPELPTIAESGVPGYEVSAWFGLLAPARVPSAIVERLYAEARNAVRNPEVVRRMEAEGTAAVGNPPREFAAEVKKEFDKWRALVKTAGLKL